MSGIPKELDETAYVDGYPFNIFSGRYLSPQLLQELE